MEKKCVKKVAARVRCLLPTKLCVCEAKRKNIDFFSQILCAVKISIFSNFFLFLPFLSQLEGEKKQILTLDVVIEATKYTNTHTVYATREKK